MRTKAKTLVSLTLMLTVVFSTGFFAQAQTAPVRKKRLRPSLATASGFIGDESHDRYVVACAPWADHDRQNFLAARGDNNASFTVARSPSFLGARPVKFGRETNGGRNWTGRIPAAGDYYIYVVAHPSARDALRVTVR